MADSSDEWTPEDLEAEATLLSLAPGTFVELNGLVLVCGKDGMRAAMSPDAWQAIRGEAK